jgi:hypothetical protein
MIQQVSNGYDPNPYPDADWRSLAFLKYSNYAVCNKKAIINLTTGYVSHGHENNGGYVKVCMVRDDGLATTKSMHNIVAKTFHGIPEDPDLTPHHINRIRSDNRPENLKWATRSEQTLERDIPEHKRGKAVTQMTLDGFEIMTWFSISAAAESLGMSLSNITRSIKCNGTAGGFKWKWEYGYIEGESWRAVPLPNHETVFVSTKGRFCSSKMVVTYGSTTDDGYKTVNIASKTGKYKLYLIHVLIMIAFFGYSEKEVNHKDGNKRNNKIENLEYMTRGENIGHAYATGLRSYNRNGKCSKRVKQMSLDGKILAVYPSIMEASRQTGINDRCIGMLCKSGNPEGRAGGNYHWAYASKSDKAESHDLNTKLDEAAGLQGRKRTIHQYRKDGTYVATYDSQVAAAKAVGVANSCNIGIACNKEGASSAGFFWRFAAPEYKVGEPLVLTGNEFQLKSTKVEQRKLNGEFVAFHDSIAEASRKTGIQHSGISQACSGKYKKSGGFLWTRTS